MIFTIDIHLLNPTILDVIVVVFNYLELFNRLFSCEVTKIRRNASLVKETSSGILTFEIRHQHEELGTLYYVIARDKCCEDDPDHYVLESAYIIW